MYIYVLYNEIVMVIIIVIKTIIYVFSYHNTTTWTIKLLLDDDYDDKGLIIHNIITYRTDSNRNDNRNSNTDN